MNKYEILEGKLTAINAYIDTMCLESNATMEYLKQYKEYVNELIIAIQNRTCLLYTADAAHEKERVGPGGPGISKKKKQQKS